MNVVVIVRINSPGNDGPITQSNITVASSTAANAASTAQDAANTAAATTQQATSAATATQAAAGNLARIVRLASPGKDGAVSQTNGAVGGSDATNASKTIQQVAAPKPAVEPQPRRAGAAASTRSARRERQPATTVRPRAASSPSPAAPTVAPVRTTHAAAVKKAAPAHRPGAVAQKSPSHAHQLPTLSSITSGAAQALSPLVPPASAVGATPSDDLSDPVLLALLLAAAVAAAAFALRRVPARRRAASWRTPR
jgi:hypothetical protein